MADTLPRNVFSADVLTARSELSRLGTPLHAWRSGAFSCEAHAIGPSVWVTMTYEGTRLALRATRDPGDEPLGAVYADIGSEELVIDCRSALAAHRVRIRSHARGAATTIRCTASVLPVNDLVLSTRSRDVYVLRAEEFAAEPAGRIYARQSGLQTGSLFATVQSPSDFSLFYLQNLSTLAGYFEQTQTTPADAVGGSWPELGFQLPVSSTNMLLAGNEYVISDAYLTLEPGAPPDDGAAAERYLDALAHTLRLFDPARTDFHPWPEKARATVFDLSQSPLCTRELNGHRYLMPYVGDAGKPPESMVQLSLLVALMEYQRWSGEQLRLVRDLLRNVPTFYDEAIGSIVRWLPGARFTEREDEHQTHEAMDSWYLYHIIFNLERLARAGVRQARTLLEKSLPYAIRVARRFSYRWPIFFNLKTLDIIQAEAAKGSGGENDVSGLYALVMLHAYELFEEPEYLEEAKRGADALQGLGFHVTYQTNTTGFAAEAMLRLALITGEERYRKLSHICLANLFDTTAIWERSYGYSRAYGTFFALYPLRDAPYVAAYEEAEALAKVYEYLRLGGRTVRASVKYLMCEYARHLLSRGWNYYPAHLPAETVAEKSRNGRVVRALAIPLEDLQDGTQQSGQVGQEIYGSGLALVCATRHYHRIAGTPLVVFCEYPMWEVGRGRLQVAGDSDSTCTLRVLSTDPNITADVAYLSLKNMRARKIERSPEGHLMAEVHGGEIVTVRRRTAR